MEKDITISWSKKSVAISLIFYFSNSCWNIGFTKCEKSKRNGKATRNIRGSKLKMLWQLIIPGWRLEDVFIHISLWIWRAPKTQYPLHMHSFHDTHIKYVTSRDMIFSHKTAPHFFPFPPNASTQFAVAFSFNKFLIKFVLCFHFFAKKHEKSVFTHCNSSRCVVTREYCIEIPTYSTSMRKKAQNVDCCKAG